MPERFMITVNGQTHQLQTASDRPLLEVLREDLALTGTKYGCGEGACGACTVILDGVAVRSCITTIEEADGAKIETIEGLADADALHAVQQAFLDNHAAQCGYCVPGQIMNAVALLRQQPKASRDRIVAAMNGNLCRCCNYRNILAAVEAAARTAVAGTAPDR